LQYDLRRRALDLGWPADRVNIIDEDQGRSGRTVEGRPGFQRLLAEVGLDHVGIILGVELSRLARSCRDWHQLIELCGLFHTLLADQNGLYDPTDHNDRLLLGLSGIMSEAELHILRGRMLAGTRSKARRGELYNHAPIGYARVPGGGLAIGEALGVLEHGGQREPSGRGGRLAAGGEQLGELVVAVEQSEFIGDAEAESALGESGVGHALGLFGDRTGRSGVE
jgi:hypothetical protein